MRARYVAVLAALAFAGCAGNTITLELPADADSMPITSHAHSVTVYCYASTEGNRRFNEELSQRRAMSVARALVASGHPANKVGVIALGPTSEFGPAEQNRRCEMRAE